MSTIAIVGAGPGLGLSIARRFGREGFGVALISRNPERLQQLVSELEAAGVVAVGFVGDVTDADSLTRALDEATERFGSIDVLEYSPAPHDPATASRMAPVDAVDLTVESLLPQLEYYLFGGVTAVQSVLPGMIERGSGTIIVSTGASSGPVIHPPFANIAAASGALRNWVLNLHAALADKGIYAAHVAIAAWIGKGGPDAEPDAIAEAFWELYSTGTEAELFYSAMPPEAVGDQA